MKNDLYGVRTLSYDPENKFYEERTLVLHALNEQEAASKVEKHMRLYCVQIGLSYVGYVEVFKIVDDPDEDIFEAYSLMRYSDLDSSDYVKRFMANGKEVNLKELNTESDASD